MSPLTILRNALERYDISPTDTLVVGVSGGVDSMVLLNCLAEAHDPVHIVAVHIDHGLRATESDEDSVFVHGVCKQLGVECITEKVNIARRAHEQKLGLEETGRIVRKEVFERVRLEHRARFILLAHHLDDTVETVLLNFFRGSKLRGLCGIAEQNEKTIRPFLEIRKSQIREYALQNTIVYREDSSNASDDFLRNRIRNRIIPEIEVINPHFRVNVQEFSSYARELMSEIDEQLAPILAKDSIHEDVLNLLSPVAQRALIERMYTSIHQTSVGLSE